MINRYLIPLFLMLLSGAVYVLFVDTHYRDIATQQGRAEILRGFIVDADNANDQIAKIQQQHESFPADGDSRLAVMLPKKIDAVRLLIDMDVVALRHGVMISSPLVNGGGAQNDSSVQKFTPYTVTFKTTATYKVFREFLADLERSLALRDIVSIKLESSDSPTDVTTATPPPEFAVFDYNMSIVTYGLQ